MLPAHNVIFSSLFTLLLIAMFAFMGGLVYLNWTLGAYSSYCYEASMIEDFASTKLVMGFGN